MFLVWLFLINLLSRIKLERPFRVRSGSVQRSGRCRVSELLNGGCDPAPSVGAGVIAVSREIVDTGTGLHERLVAVALQHQGSGAPDIDLGYHAAKIAGLGRQTFNTDNCKAHKAACPVPFDPNSSDRTESRALCGPHNLGMTCEGNQNF